VVTVASSDGSTKSSNDGSEPYTPQGCASVGGPAQVSLAWFVLPGLPILTWLRRRRS
jgi:hypothetical protein